MTARRYSRGTTALVGVGLLVGFLAGIGAPAAAHEVARTSHKINGAHLAKNSVTGKQVDESSLAAVPNADAAKTADTATTADTAKSADTATTADTAKSADNLGGLPPSAYASATTATTTGVVDVPKTNAQSKRVFFSRAPLQWEASCTPPNAADITFNVVVKASENVILSTPSGNTNIAAGGSALVEGFTTFGGSVSSYPYTVIGDDGASYTGTLVMSIAHPDLCDLIITATG